MKKALVFFISLLLLTKAFSFEVAKYAGEFLSTGAGSRALAMGGTYVAMSGDVTSGYWNPSALVDLQYPEIAFMHSRRFGGVVNYDYLGMATPFRSGSSLGIGVIRLAVDDIPITAIPRPDLPIDALYTDESGTIIANRPYIEKSVNDAEYALYLSYGQKHSESFYYGLNAKFVNKSVGDYSAWGIGFDLAAWFQPLYDLQLGINVQDITTTLLAWNTGKRELISPTVKTGLGYPFSIKRLSSTLYMAADTDIRFEGRDIAAQAAYGPVSLDFHLGAEWFYKRLFAIRIGTDSGHFTAGAGICLPRLDIDYAFLSHDELETTHRVSVRVRLEESTFARK
ncbi:PorV/PorQ family protein [candidate division KSB1 bacterium]|nr:PorV/PorQ family protein [candidate division KSB1 bacterium]